MRSFLLYTLWIVAVSAGHTPLFSQKGSGAFDRQLLYAAFSSGSVDKIDQQLTLLDQSAMQERTAFEGALLMKKAGLVSNPAKKLNLFKDGNKKLESAISKDRENTEYRFLRLMIQENAPRILGYNDNIKEDSDLVARSYKKLPAEVQEAIIQYSKTSKSLRINDL